MKSAYNGEGCAKTATEVITPAVDWNAPDMRDIDRVECYDAYGRVRNTMRRPDMKLTLTVAEAEALWMVTQLVGGFPETTRRGQIDRVRRKLVQAGVQMIPEMIRGNYASESSGITFIR